MEQRLQHRIACKSKGKLSLGQKLDIITQHQSRDPDTRKTQVSTAPACAHDSRALAAWGVCLTLTAARVRLLVLQAQLAQIYGKSRSAISKILRPENIAKLKSISDTGVRKGTCLFENP